MRLIIQSTVFKGRGAENYLATIFEQPERRALVCASAGNWGLALAWSCQARDYPITVFVPTNANQVKVRQIAALGAEVIRFGDDFDSAKTEAKRYSQAHKAWFVEDGKAVAVTEGAGSLGVELTSSGEYFDAIYVPLGNGALINGIAHWMKASSPATKIIGVVPKGADSMYCSWKQSELVSRDSVNTIADGLAVRIPVPDAVEDMKGMIDDVILVEESQIIAAMDLIESHQSMLLEPSGATGIAGVMAAYERGTLEGNIAVILTGANRE